MLRNQPEYDLFLELTVRCRVCGKVDNVGMQIDVANLLDSIDGHTSEHVTNHVNGHIHKTGGRNDHA